MYTQEHPHGPIKSHLDPDRDAKTTPGKWDLSSLPEPVHKPLEASDQNEAAEQPPSAGAPMPKRYKEMHLDPYLDDPSPESCWGHQI